VVSGVKGGFKHWQCLSVCLSPLHLLRYCRLSFRRIPVTEVCGLFNYGCWSAGFLMHWYAPDGFAFTWLPVQLSLYHKFFKVSTHYYAVDWVRCPDSICMGPVRSSDAGRPQSRGVKSHTQSANWSQILRRAAGQNAKDRGCTDWSYGDHRSSLLNPLIYTHTSAIWVQL